MISDSGTISEESSILGYPAVTLRGSMERPEALESGSIMMTGLNPDNLLRCISLNMSLDFEYRPQTDTTPTSFHPRS